MQFSIRNAFGGVLCYFSGVSWNVVFSREFVRLYSRSPVSCCAYSIAARMEFCLDQLSSTDKERAGGVPFQFHSVIISHVKT